MGIGAAWTAGNAPDEAGVVRNHLLHLHRVTSHALPKLDERIEQRNTARMLFPHPRHAFRPHLRTCAAGRLAVRGKSSEPNCSRATR